MKKFKIIADSSSNLSKGYINDENVGFDVVPLHLIVGTRDYEDSSEENVDLFLKDFLSSKDKAGTTCPTPYAYEQASEEAEITFIVTIASTMSGSYNSAVLAKNDSDKKIYVVDSLSTAGVLVDIVDFIYNELKENKDPDTIFEEVNKYRDSRKLLFILNHFDALVRTGRMSKIASAIAMLLFIRPLCAAENGKIVIKEKTRTFKSAMRKLVDSIGKEVEDFATRQCIITHVHNEEGAKELQTMIEEKYNFKSIRIMKARGINTFYAMEQGLMVSF